MQSEAKPICRNKRKRGNQLFWDKIADIGKNSTIQPAAQKDPSERPAKMVAETPDEGVKGEWLFKRQSECPENATSYDSVIRSSLSQKVAF